MSRLLALVFLAGAILSSQVQTAPAKIELGDSEAAVHEKLGQPTSYYAPEPGKHFYGDAEYRAALDVYGSVLDVYTRKTANNEYEIRVWYLTDQSTSRLHPEERVHRVTFIVDKPAVATNLLNDIAEAREVCSQGCRLWGVALAGGAQEVVAFADHASSTDQMKATQVASGWKGDPSSHSWVRAVRLMWENHPSYGASAPPARALKEQLIEEVEISVFDPVFEQRMAAGSLAAHRPIVDMGSFTAAAPTPPQN